MARTLATERIAKPAAPSRMAAGTAASGARLPTAAKLRTMLVALYSSTASEAAIGGLNQERSADASVTSCTAGCTAWLTVPAPEEENHFHRHIRRCFQLMTVDSTLFNVSCNLTLMFLGNIGTMWEHKPKPENDVWVEFPPLAVPVPHHILRANTGLDICYLLLAGSVRGAMQGHVPACHTHLPGRAAAAGAGLRSWCRRAVARSAGTWVAAAACPSCMRRRRCPRTADNGVVSAPAV